MRVGMLESRAVCVQHVVIRSEYQLPLVHLISCFLRGLTASLHCEHVAVAQLREVAAPALHITESVGGALL